ncbi:hypothetical protein TNCV_1957721 [Trichonephila clavipes]|nr:hypothetical protein TNCV_1957721 [Trichonephila clavipes]
MRVTYRLNTGHPVCEMSCSLHPFDFKLQKYTSSRCRDQLPWSKDDWGKSSSVMIHISVCTVTQGMFSSRDNTNVDICCQSEPLWLRWSDGSARDHDKLTYQFLCV